MKSIGLQKSQFLNSLVNWEKFGSATWVYFQKIQFFIVFMNWEKLKSLARETFKNPKIFLLTGKNLEVHPKTNTQKNPISIFEQIRKMHVLI